MALPRMLVSVAKNWRRVVPLMRDERVPSALKVATAFGALLIISPIDVFSDIPVLGVLDDAVLLTLLCGTFVLIATRIIEKNVTPRRTSTDVPYLSK